MPAQLFPILFGEAARVRGDVVAGSDFAQREIEADGFLVARVTHAAAEGAADRRIDRRRHIAI